MPEQPEMRPITGFNGLYSITADGRIWSHPKSWKDFREKSHGGCWMNPTLNQAGYLVVNLHKDGGRYRYRVHRLVAAAFVQNNAPEKYDQVNHLNGVKTDNRAENLEWCDASRNMQHSHDIGLRAAAKDRREKARRQSVA